MASQILPININNFVKGFLTEVSPLSYPDGASLDEVNFTLKKDGTRRRRFGMKAESETDVISITGQYGLTNMFVWESPAGVPESKLLVTQDGGKVLIFDLNANVIGGSKLFETVIDSNNSGRLFSFSNIDGSLVIASGVGDITKVERKRDGSFKESTFRLLVRDVFGVDDGIWEGNKVSERPLTKDITPEHLYNLRNQSWGVARKSVDVDLMDPIYAWTSFQKLINAPTRNFPSNADSVIKALFSNPNNQSDRLTKQFHPAEVFNNPPGTTEAAKGFFIIDALNRSESRIEEYNKAIKKLNPIPQGLERLPLDRTELGATVVSEFAGRAWFAGFGVTNSEDKRSPNLASYVLFSQLVTDSSKIGLCYQEADPTGADENELVDTDGGFVKLDGAYGVKKMVNIGSRLVVLCENGVWSIEGGSGYGFSATNYLVKKISDRGISGISSVVDTDAGVFFWSESGIYILRGDQLGDFVIESLSTNTIQKFYDKIRQEHKMTCSGSYDSYEQVVRWVYGGYNELVFDINLGAFYKYEYKGSNSIRGVFNVPSYKDEENSYKVTVNGEDVTVDGEDVFVTFSSLIGYTREIKYAYTTIDGKLGFSSLSDETFKDWGLFDADAYMITGQLTGGDFMRNKEVPYLILHFMQTETGYDNNYELINPGGCKVRVVWDWTTSRESGKWGREFQGYRFRRLFLPSQSDIPSDNGFETVVTKNRIRGRGRAVSIHFKTEPNKDCHILGWSMLLGVNANV